MATVIYRISDAGYNKVKPSYINNENCLKNALSIFPPNKHYWLIIADNISEQTFQMIQDISFAFSIKQVSIGHGAGTFNIALDYALTKDENEIIYFLENDYIHKIGSSEILEDGFKLGADYMTLYLHPDKFLSPFEGGNPEVDTDGGYQTKIYKGEKELYGMFNSTTMTFAAKVKTLKEDEQILRKWTSGTHPNDFQMFLELRDKGKSLLCPLNTYSTHGETQWLAPFVNWDMLKKPSISEYMLRLYEEIKHGDNEHQWWLLDKIENFIKENNL